MSKIDKDGPNHPLVSYNQREVGIAVVNFDIVSKGEPKCIQIDRRLDKGDPINICNIIDFEAVLYCTMGYQIPVADLEARIRLLDDIACYLLSDLHCLVEHGLYVAISHVKNEIFVDVCGGYLGAIGVWDCDKLQDTGR